MKKKSIDKDYAAGSRAFNRLDPNDYKIVRGMHVPFTTHKGRTPAEPKLHLQKLRVGECYLVPVPARLNVMARRAFRWRISAHVRDQAANWGHRYATRSLNDGHTIGIWRIK